MQEKIEEKETGGVPLPEDVRTYVLDADNAQLAELGYKNEFKREFGLLETVCFSFSIMVRGFSVIRVYTDHLGDRRVHIFHPFLRLGQWRPCWSRLGLVHPILLRHFRGVEHGRVGFIHAVGPSEKSNRSVRLVSLFKDERGPVLFFSKDGP